MQDAFRSLDFTSRHGSHGDTLARAHAAAVANRLDEAERLCNAVLEKRPASPAATALLAVITLQRGQAQKAADLMREVIRDDPDSIEAVAWLANLQRDQKSFEEAMELSDRLISRWPDNPSGHVSMALCCADQGFLMNAVEHLKLAIDIAPDRAQTRYYLGTIYEQLVRHADAAAEYRLAAEAAPELPAYHRALARMLLALGRSDEALESERQAVEAAPTAEGALMLAEALAARNRLEEAEQLCRKAIELDPASGDAYLRLGYLHLMAGRFREAEESLQQAIDLDPTNAHAYLGVTGSRKMTAEDLPMIRRMHQIADDPSTNHLDLRHVHYALGKSYADIGDYERAMAHYDLANEYAFEVELNGVPFDHAEHDRYTNRQIGLFTGKYFRSHRDVGCPSETPVFIIGMIRSGTTLTEQILSSHPEVGGAGELSYWSDPERAKLNSLLMMGMAPLPLLNEAAREYVKLLEQIAPGKKRVTDKMPMNCLLAGIIHLLLPNARIIHCRRNPIDTCLSIWTTPNAQSCGFNHNRQSIVDGYVAYLRLMEHWRRVIPSNRWLDVDYEDLVANRERVVRTMVEFCGLEWDDACLRHEQNRRSVRTPSLWQARQPVYTDSVEKWRKYEPWLREFASLTGLADESTLQARQDARSSR